MAVPRTTAESDELAAARREAAQWRVRTREAEQAADNAEQLLDTLLDLISDRVIEGMRNRGWVEFHRERPTTSNEQKGTHSASTPADHTHHHYGRTTTP